MLRSSVGILQAFIQMKLIAPPFSSKLSRGIYKSVLQKLFIKSPKEVRSPFNSVDIILAFERSKRLLAVSYFAAQAVCCLMSARSEERTSFWTGLYCFFSITCFRLFDLL